MSKTRLGVSLYPERSTFEKDVAYLERAANRGFDVLFIALLPGKGGAAELKAQYGPLLNRAKELGFEISADVNPMVFDRLGVNASFFRGQIDLSLFADLGVDVLRLDIGLSDIEMAFLSKNRWGIKVCVNAAAAYDPIDHVIRAGGDPEMLVGCMNYYPHRYTGVSIERYCRARDVWNAHGLRFQTFVTSQAPGQFGPWPVTEGLPTCEDHRDLPMGVQVKHLLMMGGVDDIVVGNAYADDEELDAMAAARDEALCLKVRCVEGLPEAQRLLLGCAMSKRGDSGDYLIRTLETRIGNASPIVPFNTVDIHRGDVLIDNDLYGQYSGEVQIARREMKNSGKTNVAGHIDADEVFLIDVIRGGQSFGFTLVDDEA